LGPRSCAVSGSPLALSIIVLVAHADVEPVFVVRVVEDALTTLA
jgi:hypothetical protein